MKKYINYINITSFNYIINSIIKISYKNKIGLYETIIYLYIKDLLFRNELDDKINVICKNKKINPFKS
jgi:hypothetical protein